VEIGQTETAVAGHQQRRADSHLRQCGWTDTWFADYGKVFNIGVYPYVEVQIEVYPREDRDERIILLRGELLRALRPLT